MFGLILHGVGGTFLFLLWIWAVLDVIATDNILIRSLPKTTWLMLVLFIPSIGAVAWILLGRPEGAGISLGGQRSSLYVDGEYEDWRPSSRSSFAGPEDDPAWRSSKSTSKSLPASLQDDEPLAIRERKLLEKEAELAKREAELDSAERDSKAAEPDDESDA